MQNRLLLCYIIGAAAQLDLLRDLVRNANGHNMYERMAALANGNNADDDSAYVEPTAQYVEQPPSALNPSYATTLIALSKTAPRSVVDGVAASLGVSQAELDIILDPPQADVLLYDSDDPRGADRIQPVAQPGAQPVAAQSVPAQPEAQPPLEKQIELLLSLLMNKQETPTTTTTTTTTQARAPEVDQSGLLSLLLNMIPLDTLLGQRANRQASEDMLTGASIGAVSAPATPEMATPTVVDDSAAVSRSKDSGTGAQRKKKGDFFISFGGSWDKALDLIHEKSVDKNKGSLVDAIDALARAKAAKAGRNKHAGKSLLNDIIPMMPQVMPQIMPMQVIPQPPPAIVQPQPQVIHNPIEIIEYVDVEASPEPCSTCAMVKKPKCIGECVRVRYDGSSPDGRVIEKVLG